MRPESGRKRVVLWVIAVFVMLGSIAPQQGYAKEPPATCSQATLTGRYVFGATGYNFVNGSAVPKTVTEFLTFQGDGSLTSIATLVIGGTKIQDDAAGTGNYTVNEDCTGRLTFTGTPLVFDLFISANGSRFNVIQIAPDGQMIAGQAQRVPH